ncbi:hypothetical protein B0A48_17593 [Cryoendolithus antarcticus]|uniref:Uncharacterized protein n=1 Tax=Cryoendolithus antarcticus TaxID=1507870 RepID=A0A1V8SBD7_9PEZI|nr:hypothetical protein B0A48_17593 [Cryoendolithus antarcticus]
MRPSTALAPLLCCTIAVHAQSPTQQRLHAESGAARPWPADILGNSNATYCPLVPVQEQRFEIEFIEIAPCPIVSDHVFYIWMYGSIWRDRAINLTEEILANATLTIKFNITYVDGAFDSFKPLTIPMAPTALSRWNHIDIRNMTGAHKERMVLGGNDVVSDGVILRQWVVAGNWTMEFDARVPDGRCLFDFSLTQWMDGDFDPRGAEDSSWLAKAFGSGSGLPSSDVPRELNNATYGKTPAKDQLFTIEFLDVAPFPIVSGELYYVYLYANFWPQWTPGLSEADLAKATLSITFSIIYADGSQDHSKPWTIPLESKMLDRFRHIGIRNETGHATDHMSLRANDIAADGYVPKQFVVSRNWTMEFDARLPDGTCLFDFAMTQWVNGNLQRHV